MKYFAIDWEGTTGTRSKIVIATGFPLPTFYIIYTSCEYIYITLPFITNYSLLINTTMKFKLRFLTALSSLFTISASAQISSGPGTLQLPKPPGQVQPVNGSVYKIKNVNSGRYAQTANASTENGATLHLYDNSNDDHFKWNTIVVKDGYYKFQNVRSKKFLAVLGGSKDVYGILCQWDDTGQPDINWKLEKAASGYKLKNKNSNLFAAVEGGSKNNEAKLVQWNDAGQPDILWQFELVKQQPGSPTTPAPSTGKKVLVDVILNSIAVSESTRNRIDNGDCKRIFGTILTELWELDENNEMKNKLGSYNNMQQAVYVQKNYQSPPPIALSFYQDNVSNAGNNEMGKVTYNIPEALLLQKRVMLVVKTNIGTRHKDNNFATYDCLKMEKEIQSTFILGTGTGNKYLLEGTDGQIQVNTDQASSGRNMHIQDMIIPFAIFQNTDDTHKIWVKLSCVKK